jgi:2-polyprenyl-3-methyl-5-hydroxy-6-metoxy-1,4-benzoquinol methylase
MRIGARPDSLLERVGVLFNKVPTPIGEAMFSMPVARSLQVAQRTGLLAALAEGPRDPSELAEHLGLQPTGTRRVLDVVASLGYLKVGADGRYEMTSSGRPWLDPASDTYLGDFLADTAHYWDWYAGLEDLVRDGRHVELHGKAPDDPYWDSYIRGQYQLARLSSAEVAKAIPLAAGAHSVLDVAGAHGEFSMALCRRHQGLRATVVDLPGSARVGRQIVAEGGMTDRVRHLVGDMFEVDYEGHYDGALCFNIVHHLTADQARTLFARIRSSLRPGAPIAILELYDSPSGRPANLASILGLFFHLTSGADTYSVEEVSHWLRETGYGEAKTRTFRTLPDLQLLVAKAV